MAQRRGDFFKMGSKICLCHIASGPSAIETSREPILDRLSSDFIRLDCEPTFSKTGSGLNLCRRASEPSASQSRRGSTLQRLLSDSVGSDKGGLFFKMGSENGL